MRNEETVGLSPAARMTVIVLALLMAPLSPAVFASTTRPHRSTKARPPVPAPVEEDDAIEITATDGIEPTPKATPQPLLSQPSVESLIIRSATPWVPPNLWANALSPDGKFQLEARSSGKATRITLSNLSDGFKVDLSSDGIRCVSFSGDGRFASGHHDGNVRVWDSATGGIALNLKGSEAAITSVAFAHDGSLVAAGTADGQVLVWDASPSDERARDSQYELAQQDVAISCVRWSPQGDSLAISLAAWNDLEHPELVVWNPSDDEVTHRLTLTRPAGAISWLGEDAIVAADWNGMASVWELASGEATSRMELEKNSLSAAAWSPDCPLVPRRRVEELLQEAP